MLSYSFNQIGIFAEYIMDIEQFTELYCENKDKPELKCNGKCHLSDQLADNQEEKESKEIHVSPEILMFLDEAIVEVQEKTEFHVEENISYYFNTDLTKGIVNPIFQPPQTKTV
ncbi:hypothetical protein DIT68_06705 [Brumimicrobium oceani]|uniref:Uncharacterized protein n=2 Tax=Brumimicrobium oceani TaxID=2100725 RepID=A0A2U2XDC6_9FLAO|nr:hypothetical protein DIT68_06705 [Brumimicrobium oceani]